MYTNFARHTRLTMYGAACLGIVLAAGCKGRTDTATTDGASSPPAADSSATGMAPAANDTGMGNDGAMTDANIVALLDEANKADSAAGAYALGKAANADVKSFAKMMMGEHHALRAQGQALAKKLNVTPEPPADDPVAAAGQSEMAALKAAGKGAAFDSVYIGQEVTIHKAVLDLANKAHGDAKNEELKKLIEAAKPTIQKHLDKAESLQKTIGKSTT
jgi:putative membrane protein